MCMNACQYVCMHSTYRQDPAKFRREHHTPWNWSYRVGAVPDPGPLEEKPVLLTVWRAVADSKQGACTLRAQRHPTTTSWLSSQMYMIWVSCSLKLCLSLSLPSPSFHYNRPQFKHGTMDI